METEELNNIMCIYHKNCTDGFASALAVKVWADKQSKEVDFQPAIYGDSPPNVRGKDLFIVDFSYPRDVLLEIYENANSIVVLDHHKTAKEALAGLDFCIFDMTKSGAVLTWEHLFPNQKIPLLLLYIQDRDLWNWELEQSREISASLQAMDMDFDVWEQYLNNDQIPELVVKGEAILEYQQKKVKKIAHEYVPLIDICGYKVPCVNTTHLISEIGNELSKGYAFAVMYFETANDRIYSLRSAENGIDVSEIAKKFGGGGHFHAAGFKVTKPEVTLTPLEAC